ncbi:MAG: vWA domain-containing protein [Elainellaceae cyanobacterium]
MISSLPNPPFPNRCGLDVVIVIDESGSVDNVEIEQVREAARQFIDALAGTPSKIGIVIFNIEATVILELTSVLDPNGAKTVKAALNFPRKGTGTNWQAAFNTARTLQGDLIIFTTDGNPGGSQSIIAPLQNGVGAANQIKSDGTRIVAIGIGDNLNVENLKAISGPIENDDFYLSNFGTLANQLRAIALRLCGSSITAIKKVKQPDGSHAAAAGWQFAIHLAGAVPQSLVTTPADGITREDGVVNFRWRVQNLQGISQATVTETPQDQFILTDVVVTETEGHPIPVETVPNGVSLNVAVDDIISSEFFSEKVESYALVFSKTPDRSTPLRRLEGSTVGGDIYAFVFPSEGIDRVDFSFGRADNRPTQIERHAPFDLEGGDVTTAKPLDTRRIRNGQYDIDARLRLTDGTETRLTTPFTIDNHPPLPSDYKLVFSKHPDRSEPILDLNNATVEGAIYAFLTPDIDLYIEQVKYWLDDPDRTGPTHQVENAVPYDFEGGSVKTATPFDTRQVTNGTHTITTEVLLREGTQVIFDTIITVV